MKNIKLLMVGNSLSRDAAMHLRGLLLESGYDDAIVAYIAVGGCSIDSHYRKAINNEDDYGYMKNAMGKWIAENRTLEYALADEEWDVITLQQATAKSVESESFSNLRPLTEYIRAHSTNKNMKLYWYMTWAFGKYCSRTSFDEKYGRDADKMYKDIVSTVKDVIMQDPNIDGVIPAGTAFQNVITSYLTDIHEDGVHASLFLGRYLAAMVFACYISGVSADKLGNTYIPEFCIFDRIDVLREAADAAIKNPFEKTPSKLTYKKSLKVLAVGNEQTDDSTAYLFELLDGAGVDAVVGCVSLNGANLDKHAELISSGCAEYIYRKKNSPDEWVTMQSDIKNAVRDENWDVIVLSQEIFDYAFTDTYSHLDEILAFVKENSTNKDVKIVWNLPWTCQGDTEDSRFDRFDRDGKKMYDAFLDVCKNFIFPDKRFCGIIPTGTVIQGMRTSFIGDNLTRDGVNLTLDLGRYAASLTWAGYLTGIPARLFTCAPDEYKDKIEIHRMIMNDSCYYAFRQPYLFRASKFVEIAELGLDTDYTKG